MQIKGQTDTIIWQNQAALPSTARIDYASFIIDSDYYIIGGLDGGSNTYSEVWKYNIPSNTWQQMRNFPGGPVSEPVGFSINSYGYICCGIDSVTGYNFDNEFWKYYPAVDTWQHKANYPGVPREEPIKFVYGQYAYVGMGLYVNDLWRYNSTTDNWDSVSNIPTGSVAAPGISIIDSFAYILGGENAVTQFNGIWRYNINQDHWDSIGIMPGGLRTGPLYWTFDKTVVIGYGFILDTVNSSVGDTMAQDIYRYNTQTGIWDTLRCLNFVDSTADDGGGCFLLDKTAYFFGGFKTDFPNTSYYNNMWSFDASKFLTDTSTGINDIKPDVSFKVYPNPMDKENSLNVQCTEVGEITFYDLLGQVTYKGQLVTGINTFNCLQLSCENSVILYKAKMKSGKTETGKVIMLNR